MRPLIFAGLALALANGGTGCARATGTSDTLGNPPNDGGSGGSVPVNLDGGGDAATHPDGPAACPKGACNYQTGAGCSGATTACVPATAPDGGVVPFCFAPGTKGPGAACAQPTDCVAGYVCAQGACHKLCCGGDWTGCGSASEHCIEALSYESAMGASIPTGAMLCYPVGTCDPLTPSSCTQPGTACLVVDPTGAAACFPPGAGQAGQPCPCAGGFVCDDEFVNGGGKTCVRLCKAVIGGGAPYCQPNEGICTHYTRDLPGVGECQPPSSN
jgi:hypothetical protein